MAFWMAAMAITGLVSAGVAAEGQRKAGIAADENAKLNSRAQMADRDMQIAEAKSQMAQLQEEYLSARNSNIAQFSPTRDSSDQSVSAFLRSNEKKVVADIAAAGTMGRAKANRMESAAAITRSEGRATKQAYNYKAASTLISGISNYAATRVT
jgi:hypothetical protein